MYVSMYVCTLACMYVCMNACMHVCMYEYFANNYVQLFKASCFLTTSVRSYVKQGQGNAKRFCNCQYYIAISKCQGIYGYFCDNVVYPDILLILIS